MYAGVATTTVGASVLGAAAGSDALARTGMLTAAWTLIALVMILIGIGMMRSSRRSRTSSGSRSRIMGRPAFGRRRWAD